MDEHFINLYQKFIESFLIYKILVPILVTKLLRSDSTGCYEFFFVYVFVWKLTAIDDLFKYGITQTNLQTNLQYYTELNSPEIVFKILAIYDAGANWNRLLIGLPVDLKEIACDELLLE